MRAPAGRDVAEGVEAFDHKTLKKVAFVWDCDLANFKLCRRGSEAAGLAAQFAAVAAKARRGSHQPWSCSGI
jgi:hypothetical protein